MPALLLSDRQVIAVTGPQAETFLQNIITPDLPSLPEGELRQGALLTPQGKVMFDFLVARDDAGGFLIEAARPVVADLVKRLTLYKLRADVAISAVGDLHVVVLWEQSADGTLRDTRFRGDDAVFRSYRADVPEDTAAPEAYVRLRIANAVAESPQDFALSDAFPHDVLFDLNDGVSFRKGCFVGQEVVSRMQHRGTARRRIMIAEAAGDLPPAGTAVSVDGRTVGALGTVAGQKALALVRTDKVADAADAGTPITADGVALSLSFAPWSGLSLKRPATP